VARGQVGIEAVRRVPEPEVAQGLHHAVGQRMTAVAFPAGVLVDVVAEERHQVDVLVDELAVRAVRARLVHLAVRDRDREALRRPVGQRGGAPDRARVLAIAEPIPVAGARHQVVDDRVHAVGVLRRGTELAGRHQVVERVVGRHLPAHRHLLGGHGPSTVIHRGVERQAGPEHHARRGGIARGHPERERVAAEVQLGPGRRGRGHPGVGRSRGGVAGVAAWAAPRSHQRGRGGSAHQEVPPPEPGQHPPFTLTIPLVHVQESPTSKCAGTVAHAAHPHGR
jgi:hypothetical protein